jgi:hypothetical protein
MENNGQVAGRKDITGRELIAFFDEFKESYNKGIPEVELDISLDISLREFISKYLSLDYEKISKALTSGIKIPGIETHQYIELSDLEGKFESEK